MGKGLMGNPVREVKCSVKSIATTIKKLIMLSRVFLQKNVIYFMSVILMVNQDDIPLLTVTLLSIKNTLAWSFFLSLGGEYAGVPKPLPCDNPLIIPAH